ncbi:endonuclease/exonuclease/phosphatase family protein [bacterium]|nr:endonuclease/exonuclease/phosphatase family protein [bacterium]
MKVSIRIFALFFLLTTSITFAQQSTKFNQLYNERESSTQNFLKIMSFNTYFLYDTKADPELSFEKVYTKAAFYKKVAALADVINSVSPDVLALQEVENREVLVELSHYLEKKYKIIHYESNDTYTGQDVALLYNEEALKETSEFQSNLDYKVPLLGKDGYELYPSKPLSKGILEIELEIKESGQKIVFLVSHLKSQNGGFLSDMKRFAQANTIRHKMEEIYQTKNKRIILLGDLNDINPTATLEILTGEAQCDYDYDPSKLVFFHDVLVDYPVEKNFTYIFKKYKKSGSRSVYLGTFKSRLDFIIASPLANYEIKTKYIESAFDPSSRFPSDHLPVVAHFLIRKESNMSAVHHKNSAKVDPIEPLDEELSRKKRILVEKDAWELNL